VNRLTDSQVGRRQVGRRVANRRYEEETSRDVKANVQAAKEVSREAGEQENAQAVTLAI